MIEMPRLGGPDRLQPGEPNRTTFERWVADFGLDRARRMAAEFKMERQFKRIPSLEYLRKLGTGKATIKEYIGVMVLTVMGMAGMRALENVTHVARDVNGMLIDWSLTRSLTQRRRPRS